MDWGLLFIGLVLALGEEREKNVPQDEERNSIPLAGEGNDDNTAEQEDVLDAIGFPGKVFEVEF
jgi:hypothetical protein